MLDFYAWYWVDLGCTLVNVYAAEHSFCSYSCWCDSACTRGLQKKNKKTIKQTNKQTNMRSIQRSFYLRHVRTISAIFLHNWTQCMYCFSPLLPKNVRKGIDDRCKGPANLKVFCNWKTRKNPCKCSACVESQKLAIDCGIPLPK